jgi:Mannosyl-glycoprotein endo-beta-N-acetylglucosaminidase
MADVIKSYLVSLGFKVDEPSARKFKTTLDEAEKAAVEATSGIAKEILKWQSVITGSFAAISAGVIGVIDSVAEADEKYRLFGERMLLTKDRAEVVMRTLEAMHMTVADLPLIGLDPELNKRFRSISESITNSMKMRDQDFEKNMVRWRSFTTEITKLLIKLDDLRKMFASDMIKRLGPDLDLIQGKVEEWIDYLTTHGPEIEDFFARALIPILRDTWEIFKALGDVAKNFIILFTNAVALFSNDSSLRTTTLDWEKLARAIDHVAIGLRNVLLMLSGTEAGAAALLGGNFNPSSEWFKFKRGFGDSWFPPSNEMQPSQGAGSDSASRAFQLANKVGQQTGVDPRLIFEQWAHETGGFTSNVFRNMNNMGGIKIPGTDVYRKYGSLDEFAEDYGRQISRNYPGLVGAHTERDFANALQQGRLGPYFTDDPAKYIGGMERMGRQFAGTISNTVNVNVAQTDASALDISQAVDQAMRKNNQLILSQLQQGTF